MAGIHERRIEQRFGGFFSFDEDSESEDISLDELEEELEEHKNYDVLRTILTNGEKQRGMATLVEGNLGHIEESLIQVHIGSISSEIRSLQEKSLDISVKLKNRKLVEAKLAGFVEEIVAPPGLVNILVNGELFLAGK